MDRIRKLDRRSFLARVVGGTLGGSGLLVLGASACATPPEAEAGRRMIVDTDPADPAREASEQSPTPAPNSAISDSDTGPNADPVARGRAGRRGITDSDSGPNADAAGSGRGGGGPRQSFVICPGNPRCPQ